MKKVLLMVAVACACVGSVQGQIPVVGGPFYPNGVLAQVEHWRQIVACAEAWRAFRARPDVASASVVDVAQLVHGRAGGTSAGSGLPAIDVFPAPPTALLLWAGAEAHSGPKAAMLSAELPECAEDASAAPKRNQSTATHQPQGE